MPIREIRGPDAPCHAIPWRESLHLARMMGEKAGGASRTKRRETCGDRIEGIGVDDAGNQSLFDYPQEILIVIPTESRAQCQDIVPLLQDLGVGANLSDHDFGNAGGGQKIVELWKRVEGDKAASGMNGRRGAETGGPEESRRSCQNADPAIGPFEGIKVPYG